MLADANLRPALTGYVIEWLCALLGERDDEAVKAFLVAEVVRRRGVSPEVAWAWVDSSAPMMTSESHETAGMFVRCDGCGGPMSNLTGMMVMRKGGTTQTVCPRCQGVLAAEGWTHVATARGIG